MKVQCVNMHKTLIGLVFVALLAGCSGNTYGTGVSSEQQLLDDLTNIVAIGSTDKKEKINYSSRPTLVKPPVTAALPAPAEAVQSESAYFPEDPEEKRKRLLKQLAEDGDSLDGDLSPELQALRSESLARSKTNSKSKLYANLPRDDDGYCEMCEFYERTEADKLRLASRTAERQRTNVQKRRYLTEPPDEYRAVAETAAVGVLGEKEKSEAAIAYEKRKDKPIFGRGLGR